MKKVNIQFFSTLEDNITFIKDMLQLDVNILLRMGDSELNILIDHNNIDSIKEILYKNNVEYWNSEVYFSCGAFNTSNEFNRFTSDNPNTLRLKIGEQGEDFLKESWLTTSLVFDNEEANQLFFKVGQKLKRETNCGGFLFVDTEKKKRGNVRYTKKALEFNHQGAKVYQHNPNIHFLLG